MSMDGFAPAMWRVVDSGLAEPEFTFAADEAIAIARSEGRVPNTIHLYRRRSPTVSLGRFQDAAKATDIDFCRAKGIKLIRRVSGGSAVYTDSGHLEYGICLPEAELPLGRVEAFRKTCSALVVALGSMGIEAEYKPVNDVLVGGRKISGSAQTKIGGAVLQHGTFILWNEPGMMQGALRMDEAKVRSRGLEPSNYVTSLSEILGREPDIGTVKAHVIRGFEDVFGIEATPSDLTPFESEAVKRLISEKYGRDEWNLRT